MPELPEVETVRKGLEKLVVNKTIQKVQVLWPKIIDAPEVTIFEAQLANEKIESIGRRGKFLIFHLTDYELISHLRMEGKYKFYEENVPLDKHTHVIFHFTDGTQLHYNDVRKFGRMTLVNKGMSTSYKGIMQLGPEPLPETFTLDDFSKGLAKSKKAIKPLLLDQKLVTGLGNIYVDEALWEAKIHPEQPANTLKPKEVAVLRKAIIDVLHRAVEAGGTTIRSYLNALGEAGQFQLSLHVYGQTGEPCARCQTPIVKVKVAQRGTHFCPNCQRIKIENQPTSYVLGVTGGIATGKSTVDAIFQKYGILIIDSDRIAREVVEPQTPGLQAIVDTFGQTMIQKNGQLNRQKLGELIFQDATKREQLNQLLDPFIRTAIKNAIAKNKKTHPLVVVDIPLLFEGHYESTVDSVAVVYTTPESQRTRLMKRNKLTVEEAQARIESQLPIEEKRKRADIVFENTGTKEELERQIVQWLRESKFIY